MIDQKDLDKAAHDRLAGQHNCGIFKLQDLAAANLDEAAAAREVGEKLAYAQSYGQSANMDNHLMGGLGAINGINAGRLGRSFVGPSTITLTDQTEAQLQQAKAEVQRLEELLTLLKSHPEIERILELMQGSY